MKIAIIGSGVVGQATGKGFLAVGHDVRFYDINPRVVDALKLEGYDACNVEGCVTDREVFMVSVSTPTVNDKIELSFLESAMATIGRVISEKQNGDYPVVAVRSTVPPGTTENILVPIIEKYSGKKAGLDFGVAMNPEFLREASSVQDFVNPWIVVIGADEPRSQIVMQKVYEKIKSERRVFLRIREAEAEKYVHNLWNAAKISFFNEMRMALNKVGGINTEEVFRTVMLSAEASWNLEYGVRDFGPFGGSCLPKDTQAFLSWAWDSLKEKMPLLQAVIRVNETLKEKNKN